LRGKILVDDRLNEEQTRDVAVNDPRIKQLTAGKEIIKVIVVPNKLVNIVLK
jgi:leucyl-tRNA synthetase